MSMSLITKLTVTISLVLLLVIAPFAYLNIKSLKELMLRETVTGVDSLSETIIRTTHYQMLENDRDRVRQVIEEVGSQKGIENIRMINKDGLVIFSTDRAETGTFLDKRESSCNMCHFAKKPLSQASSMNRSRIFRDHHGQESLALTKAIYNKPVCSASPCHFHPDDQEILGILDVTVSLAEMRAQTAAYRNQIVLMTVLMIGLTWGILTLALRKFVHRPVRQLVRHTAKVAGGDLESAVTVRSHDELGELTLAFNAMTQSLLKARQELEDWGKNLEVKVEERTHALNQMQTQLIRSEKLASLGELVAGIAHELNNPLTGVLVFASILGNNDKLDPECRSDIEVIVRETQRCAQIVKGLLEFSRESIPQKKRSSLNGVLDNTLSLIGNQSFFQDVEIVKDYAPDLPEVLIDPNQMEQVFINMLLNASQAMAGRGLLTIRTVLAPQPGWVCVRITDTGSGIPEEYLGRIFDPFFTTKSKGTGLGLSVSYGIVENHGGAIEVQSSKGEGTTFTVRLPVAPDEGAEAPESLPGEEPVRGLEAWSSL
ncbi:MAG: HAMP domain-containing protein [Deltaproteobacteria bacterium]|nr:HAMP domain-containing protein [Deltaproteobacteria bacterium]